MNRLVLLRHAKSSWDIPDVSDHERPLAPRGIRAVADLGRHMAATGIAPDLVLCSTARRAVETWNGVASGCPVPASIEFLPELYGATPSELRARLHVVPDDVGCVLVVGHNPTIGDFAVRIVGSGDADLRRQLETKFSTGALATVAVPEPWHALHWGVGDLSGYVVPRDLTGADTT